MIKIEVGTVVDFIRDNVRCRGIVNDLTDGLCLIPVLGSKLVYSVPQEHVVPVRRSADVVNLLRDCE